MIVVLFATGCRSTRETSSNASVISAEQTSDSTAIYEETILVPVVTPPAKVQVKVSAEDLLGLPIGGSFQKKSGNATATVTKEKDGSLTITAGCDSLVLLLENTRKEVYHFQKENTALKTELSEQKTQIIKEPSGWQWFQIWLGRAAAAALLLYVIYRVIKQKINPF